MKYIEGNETFHSCPKLVNNKVDFMYPILTAHRSPEKVHKTRGD